MTRKKLTIGLFGYGCVGHGLYEVLEKTPTLKTSIKKICVKDRAKVRDLPAEMFTFERDEILNDEEINVVVELIDDADAAFEIVSRALNNKKAVVTANKKMIAENFSTLLELQLKNQVPLLYEASCCASIPIIRNLEEYYDNDLLESIEGIVNGSTNYILTKTRDENLSYELALKQAQQNGFAETDHRLDTEGFDAKYKLVILLAHAFGLVVRPDEVLNIGINNLTKAEFDFAWEKGYKIKLTAVAWRCANGNIGAFVMPRFVSCYDKLFTVDDVFNGIITTSAFTDVQFFSGKGAGAYPTASAVLSDISALSYDYRYEYKKLGGVERLENKNAIFLRVLLSFEGAQQSELRERFAEVEEIFIGQGKGSIKGLLSLKAMEKVLAEWTGRCSFVLFDLVPPPRGDFYRQEGEIALHEAFI